MKQGRLLKISRLEGLTDGVFAIAMTILALDLRTPMQLSNTIIGQYLLSTIPIKLVIYVSSFVILGTLWIAMNFQTGLLERLNRPYLWCNVLYLMIICIVPFSASLVASNPHSPVSISFYAVNLLCSSFTQFMIIQCAHKYKLNSELYSEHIRQAAVKRIFVAPIFYLASLVLCHWHPAIAFALLVIPIVVYLFPGRIDKFNT